VQTQNGKGRNVFEGLFCLSLSLRTAAQLLVCRRKNISYSLVKGKN